MLRQRLTLTTPLLNKNRGRAAVFLIHSNLSDSRITHLITHLDYSRTLKRTKAYVNLNDVQPTLWNKPLGLKQDWHRTSSKSSTPSRSSTPSTSSARSQLVLAPYPQSCSSSMLVSPTFSESSLPEYDHTSSLLAISPPPVPSKSSMPLFCGDLVPLIDKKSLEYQEHTHTNVVCTFADIACNLVLTPSAIFLTQFFQGQRRSKVTAWFERTTKLVARDFPRPVHLLCH